MATSVTPLKTVKEIRVGPLRSEDDLRKAITRLETQLNDTIRMYNELVTRLKDGTDI